MAIFNSKLLVYQRVNHKCFPIPSAMKLWNGFARWSPRLEGNVVMFQVHCRLLLSLRFIMICLGNIWESYRLLLLFL